MNPLLFFPEKSLADFFNADIAIQSSSYFKINALPAKHSSSAGSALIHLLFYANKLTAAGITTAVSIPATTSEKLPAAPAKALHSMALDVPTTCPAVP